VSDQAARARIERWKQSLLDPKDRLVDLGDHGIPLAIEPMRIAFSLAAGSMLALEAADAPGLENGRLRIALPKAELDRLLGIMRRDVRAARAEADHVLWLGLGLVTWPDETGAPRTAPLACWPVELVTGLDGGPRLRSVDDLQPRANHMLLEALQRIHDITLDMGGELNLDLLFETASSAVGWRLDRCARLMTCSFAKFDVWRDLDKREETLEGAMPIGLLCEEVLAAPLPAVNLNDALAPLDADASQLVPIATAGAGGSFMIQGAPGTGKTQTIANLAVQCAAQGKRVLVVSDRATTLDTIQQRLAGAGFGELCMPLHAGRTRVLEALSAVFGRAHRPVSGTSSAETRLAELRLALDTYAAELHKAKPLGQTIHEVLGRLVELRTSPRAPLAERDAAVVDRSTFARRKAAVIALAEAARAVEPVAAHPWQTSALEQWNPDGTERATRALNEVANIVETLLSAIADINKLVPGIVARSPEQIRALGALAELASATPRPGAELLTNMRGVKHEEIGERIALIRARGTGALEVPRDPGTFLAIATRHRALAIEVEELFTSTIDELETPGELLVQLKKWTSGIAALRFMALRNARAAVKAAAQPGKLETDESMIPALEAVIAERACREALLAAAEPAKRWFGDLGGDALSLDLPKIEEAVAWGALLRKAFDQLTINFGEPGKQTAWRSLVAQVAASQDASERPAVELAPFARLAATVGRWEPALVELATTTGIPQSLLGAGADHLASLHAQVGTLRHSVATFADWTKFHLARRDAHVAGIGPSIGAIERGDLAADELADAWERATLLAWFELEIAETPALAQFVGPTHHTFVTSFADLDRGTLGVTRARIIAKLAERLPRGADVQPELALLKQELDTVKPRTLRALFDAMPTLMPRITPIVLATPHAVAAHLDDSLFDLVVFDDASNLLMGNALGALSRAHAAVIVGDIKQLAPAEEDGLLEVARAAQLPSFTLAAHYRARHEDLFQFVNARYYDDRIEIMPAPFKGADLGVSFRFFEVGDVETIVSELRARLVDPAKAGKTCAIITLTRAQQQLVEHMLEAAAANEPALAAALTAEREPLIVGTPDRMFGEERDLVYFMLGDAPGKIDTRALTVATTRAREQLIVTASTETFTGDLAELVAFARQGGGAGKPADDVAAATPITAAIARALTDRGWLIKHQVGCGPYKLDLAVLDPADPERFVLAIEHDGLSYAKASSTRSRDRLRTQLLVSLGWRVHRIWSLDWWTDAERELQRAHGAIVAAIAASRQRAGRATLQPQPRAARSTLQPQPRAARASIAPRITTPPVVMATKVASRSSNDDTLPTQAAVGATLAAGSGPTDAVSLLPALPEGSGPITPLRLPRGAIAIGPYMAAAVPAGRRGPNDMFAPRYAQELGKCIEQVLAAEAPIHIDLLARRVGAYFGVGKVSPAIVESIRNAVPGRGVLGEEPNIVWRIGQDPTSVPSVRVAGQGMSAQRAIDLVPLAEVAAAARIVVERANGLSATDLVRDCARLLGFARITEQVSNRVGLGVRLATVRQLISIDGGKCHLMLE